MFEKLKDWFVSEVEKERTAEDSEEQQVAMAAAMLLLEVAWADHEITDDELTSVSTSLETLYDIETDQVEATVRQARTTHDQSSGIYPFTRELNERLSYEERCLLIEHLWRLISFKDANFHYEEHVIRKVSDLLYLRHSDFIRAKLKASSEPQWRID